MALKVIHFISSLKRGGRERQMFTIYKHNDTDIQEIKILYLNDVTPNYISEFDIKPNTLIKIKSVKHFGRFFEILKVLKQEKPDIVYSWGWLESLYALFAHLFVRFTFINGSVRSGIVAKKYWHYFRTILLHLSKNIIANSKAGLKANHLKRGFVLYNGIDQKFFQEKTLNPEVVLFKSKLKGIVFISVANLVPFKDYFTVLHSLNELKKGGKKFTYLIIGEGSMKFEIETKISQLNLEGDVFILGSKINVEEYLSISDVFIHSSMGEGCSNAILEAMACGLPIVATNVGGTPEIVNQDYGFLFDYKDSNQLTLSLSKLITKEDLRKWMSENAYNQAVNSFSVKSMMNNYYRITHEIYSKS